MSSLFDMYDVKVYDVLPKDVEENGREFDYKNELGRVKVVIYDDVIWIREVILNESE